MLLGLLLIIKMVLYLLAKSQGRTDSDGWQHWIEECPLSYHTTREGATIKKMSLIAMELERLNDWLVDHPAHRDNMKEHLLNVSNNVVILPVGDNGRDSEECELFVITPLDVED